MSTSRRSFLRAAPAAALAPTLLQHASQINGSVPMLGRYVGSALGQTDVDWKTREIAALRDRISGKSRERELTLPSAGRVAASIDCLQSVSQVNKHRILADRIDAQNREQSKWWASWELFDLIGVRS